MKLSHPLIKLFDYPTDAIAQALPATHSAAWNDNPHRQKTHEVHQQTRSIIFSWVPDSWIPGQKVTVQKFVHPDAALDRLVRECADRLNEQYRGTIIRLLLAELAPHAKIPAHVDRGLGLTLLHRCHVPVVTNTGVKFFIDQIPHFLETGKAYEFDNTRLHAVENDGDIPRVHLMCDILPSRFSV